MILQALLSIAFITIVTGALLTSALVNAKVAAHETAARIAEAALARGTDEFVNWAQLYVAKHGAATTWPTTRVVDQPVPGCGAQVQIQSGCPYSLTISYKTDSNSVASTSGPDLASNLQRGLSENRISGSVTAVITNASGDITAATTRSATIRVFDAPPFAIISGARDSQAMANAITSAQGDSGGYYQHDIAGFQETPDPSNPTADLNTAILLTMDCSNSKDNSDAYNPATDNNPPGNDSLAWGISGGRAFEAPCTPKYNFSLKPAIPPDVTLPNGNVYTINTFRAISWNDKNSGTSSWPK